MDWITILALGLMSPFLLIPLLFTWYLAVAGLGKILLGRSEEMGVALACRIDEDCPEGHVCIGGRCIAQ
jgi:hypothetical protein